MKVYDYLTLQEKPYISNIIKLKVFNKYDCHCAYCGRILTFKKMQIDHIFPKEHFQHWKENFKLDFNMNDLENLNPSCKYCNIDKNASPLEEWRDFLKNRYNKRFERVYKSKGKGMTFEAMLQLEVPEWDGLFYFERRENELSTI